MSRRLSLPGAASPGPMQDLCRQARRGAVRLAIDTVSVSLVAWLIGAPLAARHFNTITWYGWPFTIAVLPLVWLTMIGAFGKVLLAAAWPGSLAVSGALVESAGDGLLSLTAWLSGAPGAAMDVPAPSIGWLLLCYAYLVLLGIRRRHPHSIIGRLRRRWRVLAVAPLVSAGLSCLPPEPHEDVIVDVLSVGAGSATVLHLPDGRTGVYDVGSLSSLDVGRLTVMPALRERRIRRLHSVMVSHADYDHYSGLFTLLDSVGIRQVLVPPQFASFARSGRHAELLHRLEQHDIPLELLHRDGGTEHLPRYPGLSWEVLWPPPTLAADTASNDTSIVLKIVYAGFRVLLTGDIDRPAIEQLLRQGSDLRADVLVLPHHGSVNAATTRLLDAVGPQCAVVSSGRPGTRPPSGIEALVKDCFFLNTADVGAVRITLRKNRLSVRGFRPRRSRAIATVPPSDRSWESVAAGR